MSRPLRPPKRSHPLRSNRTKVQSYQESSAEDESDDNSGSEGGLSLSLRPRSSHRQRVSYREDSTDDGFSELEDEDSNEFLSLETPTRPAIPTPPRVHNGKPSPSRRRRTVNTRSQSKQSKASREKRRELGRPIHKRKKVDVVETDIFFSGPIPPWQTLPYHVLCDIFYYASHPLVDEMSSTRNPSVQWLVDMAKLCQAFQEPALATLYYSPPLLPATKAHGLLDLLSQPQESLSTNYTNKVKELHVDVEDLLVYKSGPTLGYFDLSKLIEKTPRVKTLRLYCKDDYDIGNPGWKIAPSRWRYPDALFSSIHASALRLRSWEWNSRFMDTNNLLTLVSQMHQNPAFRSIQEQKMLHIGMEQDRRGTDLLREQEAVVARTLNELPELNRVEFFECPALNESLLLNLPPRLTHLTITNCDGIDSANIGSFLASHGQNLRELALNHNRYLNLSFMIGLGESCSKLEKFTIDFHIYDRSSFHDVEPGFDELLSLSEVPTWPATLQDIELAHLRKWDGTAAEVFFSSLIDAAPQLHDLRRLVISATLMIGWRDRASFRDKWIQNLESVFLRRSRAPEVNRRRLHTPPHEPELFGVDLAAIMKRKSVRIAQRKLSETEDTDTSPGSNRTPTESSPPAYIQGMCDVVQVRIDNQRPSETQFNENDFLDSEQSGDEDWNGGAGW